MSCINGRLEGETMGRSIVLMEWDGSSGFTTTIPQKTGSQGSKLATWVKGDRKETVVLFEDSVGDCSQWDGRMALTGKLEILIILLHSAG